MSAYLSNSAAMDFVREQARRCFRDHPVKSHPLISAFARREISPAQALRAATELHAVVAAFPRFLAALLANDLDPALRDVLVENLYEEQGRMTPARVHLNTYRSLLTALGGPPAGAPVPPPCVGVVAYVRAMLDLCGRQPTAEGAAALAVVEEHVARASIVVGRWIALEHADVRDKHFHVHETLDVRHADELYSLAAHYCEAGQREHVERGVEMGTYLHCRLWTDVYRAALEERSGRQ